MIRLEKTKAQRKKEQIIDTTLEIVKKKGFRRITMEEIAAELELTKSSLYYYFKNKSDLLYQCHNHILKQGMGEFENVLNHEEDIEEILRKIVDIHLENTIKERETFNLLISPKDYFKQEQCEQIVVVRNQYESFFVQVIERGVREGRFKCDDIAMVKLFILGGMNWIQQWYKPNGRLSKAEIKQLFYEYTMKLLK